MRLFPHWFIRQQMRKVVNEGRPLVFYIHPREIDAEQPRLQMNALRRFKSYVNLATTEAKVSRLLDEFKVTTFQQYLAAK